MKDVAGAFDRLRATIAPSVRVTERSTDPDLVVIEMAGRRSGLLLRISGSSIAYIELRNVAELREWVIELPPEGEAFRSLLRDFDAVDVSFVESSWRVGPFPWRARSGWVELGGGVRLYWAGRATWLERAVARLPSYRETRRPLAPTIGPQGCDD